MQKNSYIYTKENLKISLNKVPIWFKEVEVKGNSSKGNIIFHSYNEYDEIWGPDAKIELNWETKGRTDYFHARQVQASIDMFNAINVVVTEKQNGWILSHEFTYWFGQRSKMVRKRYYSENIINSIFYCDMTERQFNISAYMIKDHYESYKPYVLDCFHSIICHE